MKLSPIFNIEQRQYVTKLSPAAEYASELYRDGLKMVVALREASKLYEVDIHKIASELGVRGGKIKKMRR